MRILLFGEYSGFHNHLKDGLMKLDQDVVIASRKDGFKNLPSDYSFDSGFKNRYLNYLHMVSKYVASLRELKGFDVLQIMNAGIVSYESLRFNRFILEQLIKNNQKTFLSGAGEDPVIWDYWMKHSGDLKYSWLEGAREDHLRKSSAELPQENADFLQWNKDLLAKIDGYIPIMFEYSVPYSGYPIPKRTIPIPVNIDKIKYRDNMVGNKIKIFHGLNRYGMKGTQFVEKAFEILRRKYPNDLELTIAGQLPLKEYLEVTGAANVIVDQTRSYSLAMNALFSMAQGKVVLGGNEPESATALHYSTENPAINITPDAQQIVAQVEMLLDDKIALGDLGYKSRQFVEKEHHYINVAQQYLDFWSESSGLNKRDKN
ncbi:glycosyltransferase [Chryseobacterium sp.]|uniref:glycosyltransferase n=1 Tax=Chryseobacterium sp. TaxID=1871047 RepID=UPI0011C70476|nr:glycosyltransferase [Chryseobacterium sp.]TXF77556.1 glycosyltransferase [Chryseobacterium sp.]